MIGSYGAQQAHMMRQSLHALVTNPAMHSIQTYTLPVISTVIIYRSIFLSFLFCLFCFCAAPRYVVILLAIQWLITLSFASFKPQCIVFSLDP